MKLFRKKRDSSIEKSNISKYLIYALGEVILIVIGVFIAVQLNNLNEKSNKDAKTEKLLRSMQQDLRYNILTADFFNRKYKTQDSIVYEILNNQISREDFIKDPSILTNAFNYNIYPLNDNTFKLLISHLEEQPEELYRTLAYLRYIYITYADIKDAFSERSSNFHYKRNQTLSASKPWFYKTYIEELPSEYLDYIENDPHFLNSLAEMWSLSVGNEHGMIEMIKKTSVLAYEEIENVLRARTGNDSIFQLYKKENHKNILGRYKKENDTSVVTISYENNAFMYQENNELKFTIYPISDTIFNSGEGHFFYTLKKQTDSTYQGFKKQYAGEVIHYNKL